MLEAQHAVGPICWGLVAASRSQATNCGQGLSEQGNLTVTSRLALRHMRELLTRPCRDSQPARRHREKTTQYDSLRQVLKRSPLLSQPSRSGHWREPQSLWQLSFGLSQLLST